MKKITETENNPMIYLEDNCEFKTSLSIEGSPFMDLETYIVLFTILPLLDGMMKTTEIIVHAMALLELARTTPNTFERPIIACIVAGVGYMLGIEELIREAHKFLPKSKETVDQYYMEIAVSNNLNEYVRMTCQILELLGIDSSKNGRAMDEIFTMIRGEEEL